MLENAACQENLQADIGRTVSQLSAEMAATAEKTRDAEVAATASVAADSAARQQEVWSSLDGCGGITKTNSRLIADLSAAVEAAGQKQLAAVSDLETESAAWADRFTAETASAHQRTRESAAKAVRALQEGETSLKTELETVGDSAKERSRQMATLVDTTLSGATAEFCAEKGDMVREVLADAER